MRLENVLALTNGSLVNEPFVSNFTTIVFESRAVKRGDLFIAFDESTIEDAVLNGAYGIIFDKPTQISDSEIAWIKVQNCEDALKRLLRFKLIDKEIVVYECNEIILKLALQIMTEPNFIALSGDIKSIFKSLWEVENSSIVLFSPTLVTKDLFTKIHTLSHNSLEKINIVEQTLFETSFIYENIFYERQLISPFFISYLELLFHLLKISNINFRLRKFTPIDHFEAVFTNKNFEIKEFGTSDKVLIFEKNSQLIQTQIKFLRKQAAWAKLLYIIPQIHNCKIINQYSNIVTYKNKNEIMTILKAHEFHFALIAGVDKSILAKSLTRQVQLTLDF
jgi:hypothetical protein